MKTKKIVVLILIMVMVLMTFTSVTSCDKNSIKAANAIIYDILSGNGTTVEREGELETAYAGMRIEKGDIIKTDTESQVYIRIDDTKNILLDVNSKIEVTEYTAGKLLLTLAQGECFFDVTEKLKDGEEMAFIVSNSTMSLRGTSGIVRVDENKGLFSILTGIGYVECKEVPLTKTANLYSNTKVEFELKTEKFDLGFFTEEDISDVFKKYLESSKTYETLLIENGWEFEEENVKLPEEKKKETGDNELLGYRQDKDGNWVFYEEDYILGYGPTYYGAIYNDVYPDKPVLKCEDVVYNGKEQTAVVRGYDSRYMDIENNVQTEPGTYTITVSPKGRWSDGTKDKVTCEWNFKYGEIEIVKSSFVFEYTGSPLDFDIVSNYSDTTYQYKENGSWSNKKPLCTEIGTNEFEILASQKYCETNRNKITIKIMQAKLTPSVSLKTNNSTITYNSNGGYYVIDKAEQVKPVITFKNGDGKTFNLDISSNETINVIATDYYPSLTGNVNEIYDNSAMFLKGNTPGTYKYIVSQKSTNSNYQIIKTTFNIVIEDAGNSNHIKITKE